MVQSECRLGIAAGKDEIMSELQIHQFTILGDNYAVLLHDPQTGATASIDAAEAGPIEAELERKGWKLTDVLVTHHHGDHVAGLADLKAKHGCKVTGPDNPAIAGIDNVVRDGDRFRWAGREIVAIATPGHTLDMINYHLPADGIVFTGDTLFALGCGRVFEGSMEMMWNSLSRLAALPAETRIYCGHEYTLANARFALSVDPDNAALQRRAAQVEKLRAEGKPTVPSLLSEELATNPFLRAADPAIRRHLGMEGASDAEVFAKIRERKNRG
jgi:hydroxyacylglutathione hydrolase